MLARAENKYMFIEEAYGVKQDAFDEKLTGEDDQEDEGCDVMTTVIPRGKLISAVFFSYARYAQVLPPSGWSIHALTARLLP